MRGKAVSETTKFGWVWPGDSLFQSDCSILESSTLCAEGLTPVSMGNLQPSSPLISISELSFNENIF